MSIKRLPFLLLTTFLLLYQMKTKGDIGLDNCKSVSGGVDFGLAGGNLGLGGGCLGPGCSYSGSDRVGETSVEEW